MFLVKLDILRIHKVLPDVVHALPDPSQAVWVTLSVKPVSLVLPWLLVRPRFAVTACRATIPNSHIQSFVTLALEDNFNLIRVDPLARLVKKVLAATNL